MPPLEPVLGAEPAPVLGVELLVGAASLAIAERSEGARRIRKRRVAWWRRGRRMSDADQIDMFFPDRSGFGGTIGDEESWSTLFNCK